MAKKEVYKLNKFGNGLNNALHPSRIRDTELADALNISLKAGSIGPPPFIESAESDELPTHDEYHISPGTSLFYFVHDYEMLDSATGEYLENPNIIEGGVEYIVVARKGAYWIYDSHNDKWSIKLEGHVDVSWSYVDDEHSQNHGDYLAEPEFLYIDNALRICDGNFKRNKENFRYRLKLFKRRGLICDNTPSPNARLSHEIDEDTDWDPDYPPPEDTYHFIANRNSEGQLVPYTTAFDYSNEYDMSGIFYYNYPGGTPQDAVNSCRYFLNQHFDSPNTGWGAASGDVAIDCQYENPTNWQSYNFGGGSSSTTGLIHLNWLFFDNTDTHGSLGSRTGYSSRYDYRDKGYGILNFMLWPIGGIVAGFPETGNGFRMGCGMEAQWIASDGPQRLNWDMYFRLLRSKNDTTQTDHRSTPNGGFNGLPGVIQNNVTGSSTFDGSNHFRGWGQEINDFIYDQSGILGSSFSNAGTYINVIKGFTRYTIKNTSDIYRDNLTGNDSPAFMFNTLGHHILGQYNTGGDYWAAPVVEGRNSREESEYWVSGVGAGIAYDFPDVLLGEQATPNEGTTNMYTGHWHEEAYWDASPYVHDMEREYAFCPGHLNGTEFESSHQYEKFYEVHGQNIGVLSAFNTVDVNFDAPGHDLRTDDIQKKESLMYMDFTRGQGESYAGPLPGDAEHPAPIFRMNFRILRQMWGHQVQTRYNAHVGSQPDATRAGPFQGWATSNQPDNIFGTSCWINNFSSDNDTNGYGGIITGFKVVFHTFGDLDNNYEPDIKPFLTLTLHGDNHLIDPEMYPPNLMSVQSSSGNLDYLYTNSEATYNNGSIYIDFADEDSNPWGDEEMPYTCCAISIHAMQTQFADYMRWKTRIAMTPVGDEDDDACGGPSEEFRIPAGGLGSVTGISVCELYTPSDQDTYDSTGWLLDAQMNNASGDVAEGAWLNVTQPGHYWVHYEDHTQLDLPSGGGLFECFAPPAMMGPDIPSSPYIIANLLHEDVQDIPAVFNIQGFAKGWTNRLLVTFVGVGATPDITYQFLTSCNQYDWTEFNFTGTINNPANYESIRLDTYDWAGAGHEPAAGAYEECFRVAVTYCQVNGTSYVNMNTLKDNRFPLSQGAWKESDEPCPEGLVPNEWVGVGESSNLTEFITGGYDSVTGYNPSIHLTEGRVHFDIAFQESPLIDAGGWGLATFEGFNTISDMEESGMDIDVSATVVFGCSAADFTKVENEPVVMHTVELNNRDELYHLIVKPFVTPCELYTAYNQTYDDTVLLPDNIKRVSLYYKLPEQGDEWFKLVDVDLEEGIRFEGFNKDWIPFAQVDNTGSVLSTSFSLAECGHKFRGPTATSFQLSSGYNEGSNLNLRYKTSAVVGRHAYIADIVELDNDTQKIIRRYGSRVIKSPSNRYDTFSSQNHIDIGINDGTRITKLHSYRDKLLVFKENVLYVISTSSGVEKLMSTHHGYGVSFKSAVVDTPHGVCWVNNHGIFIFDEKEQIHNITHMRVKDDGFPQFIGNDASDTGIGVRPTLSYNPATDDLLVILDSRKRGSGVSGNQNGGGYLYNFKEDALSRLDQHTSFKNVVGSQFSQTYHSNIFVDKKGVNHAFVVGTDSGGVAESSKIATWFDTPRYSTNHYTSPGFVTKSINFKDRNLRKNVYKVYLSYKILSDWLEEGELRMYYRIDDSSQASDWQECYNEVGEIWTPNVTGQNKAIVDPIYMNSDRGPLRNIKSVQFRLKAFPDGANISISGLEVNDMTIIFKTKPVK